MVRPGELPRAGGSRRLVGGMWDEALRLTPGDQSLHDNLIVEAAILGPHQTLGPANRENPVIAAVCRRLALEYPLHTVVGLRQAEAAARQIRQDPPEGRQAVRAFGH